MSNIPSHEGQRELWFRTSFSFTTMFRHLAKRPLQVHFRGGSSRSSWEWELESETCWKGSPGQHWMRLATGLVWLHLTADYFASTAVEPFGPWHTSDLQQCFVWTAESVLPSTLLINVSMSNFCRSTLEDTSSPHWSFSAHSHIYRTTRLRQSRSRADRLSYPGHRNIRAFRDASGAAPDCWSSESLCESNSHLALPNTSNLLAWVRLQVGWLMAPTSSRRSP